MRAEVLLLLVRSKGLNTLLLSTVVIQISPFPSPSLSPRTFQSSVGSRGSSCSLDRRREVSIAQCLRKAQRDPLLRNTSSGVRVTALRPPANHAESGNFHLSVARVKFARQTGLLTRPRGQLVSRLRPRDVMYGSRTWHSTLPQRDC